MIRQASVSCKSLKEKLLKCLIDVRIDASADRYCKLILQAKQVIDPSLNIHRIYLCENINMTTDMITDRIRNLIDCDKPDYNVAEGMVSRFKTIIRNIDDGHEFSDRPECVLKLLSQINDSHTLNLNYGNSEKYLKHLITATDYLFSAYGDSCFVHPQFFAERAIQKLDYISKKIYRSPSYDTEDILSIIFHLGRARSDFAEEEKREIGSLMTAALQPIKLCIKDVSCSSNDTLSSLLRRRSALQFLIDDYATFPAGNGTLLGDFYEDKINDSVKHIDNIISVWCDYLGDGVVNEENVWSVLDNDMAKWYEDEKDLEEASASEMPESHTWWADSIKRCITEASFSRKPLKDQLVKSLKYVRDEEDSSCFLAEDILCIIFHLGRVRSDFVEEEKIEIGSLMTGALDLIEMYSKQISCFSNNTLSDLLQRRSALQFLIDDYATFPAGNGTLLRDFYEDKINNSVKHIDNIIRVWCDYLGDGEVDEKEVGDRVLDCDMTKWYEDEKDLEEAGASEMPESHTWWAGSIKRCITEASLSRKPFKEQLVKCLKAVRDDKFKQCFLDLVLEAKELIDLLKSTPSIKCYGHNTLRANMIAHQLRNLISRVEPENAEDKHDLTRVEDYIECPKEHILQVLSEIENSESLKLKYGSSEDYLKHLITVMNYDCIRSPSENSKISKIARGSLIQAFPSLDENFEVEKLLSIIFRIGQACSDLSEEQKKEVGVLLIDALGPINKIMLSVDCFQGYTLGFLLQRRSALQFLLDDYATFPVGNEALLKDFYENKISESIKHIDKIIKIWCDYKGEGLYDEKLDSDFDFMDMLEYKDDSEVMKAGATRVPETHTWWPDSIKRCIKIGYNHFTWSLPFHFK